MGFVQLSDDLAEWEWFDDKTTVYVCIRLILGASWCEKCHKGVHLQRGPLALSQRELAEKCDITRQELRTILDRLIATRKITQTSTHKFSLITLVEYDCATQASTHCQPTYFYYIQTPNAMRSTRGRGEEELKKLRSAYPKETAKQQALKAFQKLKPDEDLLNKMLSSLEQHKTSVQWTKNRG